MVILDEKYYQSKIKEYIRIGIKEDFGHTIRRPAAVLIYIKYSKLDKSPSHHRSIGDLLDTIPRLIEQIEDVERIGSFPRRTHNASVTNMEDGVISPRVVNCLECKKQNIFHN